MSAKSSKSSLVRSTAKRINAMRDGDIDTSDIPALGDDFFRTARLLMPQPKKPVALRIDADVLRWFQGKGAGYQSRINAVLRAYMSTEQRRGQKP